jgi:hypothetical protein
MQSSETGLQLRNREFFENFSPKQAFEGLEALFAGKTTEIQIGYPAVQAVSCYSAKQAVEV